MKIAYLSTFYPFRGGIAQFNASLFRELEKSEEIKAYTFTTQYPNLLFPGSTQFVQNDDNADKIDAKRILNTINPFSWLLTGNSIADYAPDMLITKFWMPFFAPSLGTVYKLFKKNHTKRVAILDNVIPHEKRLGDIQLIRYFLGNCDNFIVMSDTVKYDLLKLKPDANYIQLPHPLYDNFGNKIDKKEARSKLGIEQSKKILLFFGFIRKYKGLDNLIEALNYLEDDYELMICGEVYGSFDEYSDLINQNHLNGRVHLFNQYIADNQVSDYFCAADLCVLPYKSATQSGIVGISYYFDLPVLATNTGSLREMIEPFGAGIMIDKSEPMLIAEGIKRYFGSDTNHIKENIKSYKNVASWKNFAEQIKNF